jgi:hypothetical protein
MNGPRNNRISHYNAFTDNGDQQGSNPYFSGRILNYPQFPESRNPDKDIPVKDCQTEEVPPGPAEPNQRISIPRSSHRIYGKSPERPSFNPPFNARCPGTAENLFYAKF